LGPSAVLLKGGHGPGSLIVDVLADASGGVETFESTRIATSSTHGTGCTLASAIAVGIAQGLSVRESVVRARAYVLEAIRTAPGFGHGHGPLNHAHTIGAISAAAANG
jgi:hydroxymethylpyrimidine/phosphomethylpyrimidine kinase